MSDEFYRISRLPPYVFAEVNKIKAAARAQGKDVIDLGMGNPDTPTPKHIIDKLIETVNNPRVHGYSMSKGIPGLRKALAGYYKKRFGVKLSPETEVVVTLGSKEGLASLATAITKPGDVIMVPNPSYPIHTYGFIIAGASVWSLPNFVNEEGLIDQIKDAVQHCSPKPVALVLNFPGNPTSEVVSLDFYKEVVDYCRGQGIYIISDLAYAEIYFDEDNPPPSILQIEGAKDIAIEFTSVSKTYSMAGWRVGFAAGNKKLISALTHIKSYVDYGSFTPIQVAAAIALNGPQDCVADLRRLYKERRDELVKGLKAAGWDVPVPTASMFIWAPIPEKFKEMGSLEFSKQLLQHADVAVAPGIGFGKYGEGHVRIALVENKQRIRQACKNIKKFLQSHKPSTKVAKSKKNETIS
ncbi:MAG: LL-diaminopimelate aminotransferase [Rickettsiales bacterium]|nr:LL-diaminopimelate aminotransferase [Pseudomonadota bacterium]MDA0966912.1 LL-diaminopimelate aminotransferase [Pseudomonadota bacterium]MDG4544465.1 LL-diaminopimelate aminotransferase [Rickettsiales bacterium]MDG4546616.1 LL-diaminopimelate aminotransferase [Rickettsiales bacterium]MDG4548741.1 LL-diaminopimelate aminotransferase [Rickettsiales bacterium]